MHYRLKEIYPNIFFLSFKDYYDMAMLFLRYQEFYESPKFRNKSFSIVDFMEWYAKTMGNGIFTYPKDWGGFNIPGKIIDEVRQKGIPDLNKYDAEILKIANKCKNKSSNRDFYLIGAVGKGSCLDHEIAHGLFYTVPAYRKEMIKLVKALPIDIRLVIFNALETIGYAKSVLTDECQAYLATGLPIEVCAMELGKLADPFVETYKKYRAG